VFFEPNRSQFDLNFRLFGIDVRVHPMFWLVSAIMGWGAVNLGFEFLLIWIVCVFLSVLIHELGHVVAGRLFGSYGHIVLYGFGGLAIGSSALHNRWQRVVVYFAGPLAGFLLAGLTAVVDRSLNQDETSLLLLDAIENLYWINLFWGAVNLLPVWPLDGGQISRDVLDWLQPNGGIRTSLGLSLAIAGLFAFIALTNTAYRPLSLVRAMHLDWIRGMFMILFFGAFAYNSYQLLQVEDRRRPWDRDWDPWRR
jgi:stage IV sporulation protein FB